MQVVLIIFSIVLLGVIINFAVSRKSSRILRLSALGALALIGLSLGVASIIIALSGSNNDTEESHLPIFLDVPTEAPAKSNAVEIIIFLAVLAVIIILIVAISYREKKIRQAEVKKTGPSPLFPNAGKHEDLNLKAEETPEKAKEDDGFSLDLE